MATAETNKPHFSASQLDSYTRCPEAYRRRYIEREVVPPNPAILRGKGFHHAIAANFRQKMETYRDLKAGEVMDIAVAAFETEEQENGCLVDDDELARGYETVVGEAKDSMVEMVGEHVRLQAPDYQPVYVEQEVRIELPNAPRDLLGFIDLADVERIVTDFKTAGRAKSQPDADNSTQLTIYAAGYHVLQGEPPKSVRLDTLVQTKTKNYRDIKESTRGLGDFRALSNRINAVQHAIDAGSFPPATPGAWWCGPNYCPYWSTCQYVNSERKALAGGGE